MHLRRALLLFAIVLGLAAIAASVSRPREESGERSTPPPGFPPPTEREKPPTASPGPAVHTEVTELSFDASRDETLRLATGPATVTVEVEEAGQVEIADLGVSAAGEPLTPAIFDLFVSESGRYEITFTPAAGDESRSAGTLVVETGPG